jgi:hypothetical protein
MIGDTATISRNHHGKLLNHPTKALSTIGMDPFAYHLFD